jgi:hypothetical protein
VIYEGETMTKDWKKELEAKTERKIECPACKSLEWNYVEYKDGRQMIVSPCGWELVELKGPDDDMDFSEGEGWES